MKKGGTQAKTKKKKKSQQPKKKRQKTLHGIKSPSAQRKQRLDAFVKWLENHAGCREALAERSPDLTPKAALVTAWDVTARTRASGWAEVLVFRVDQDEPCLSLCKGGGKDGMLQVGMLHANGHITILAMSILQADPPLIEVATQIKAAGAADSQKKSKTKTKTSRPPQCKKQKTHHKTKAQKNE